MSTVTTLIQPAEIVNTGILSAAPLNSRFDASKLSSVVHLAEDRFLKTFVCAAFYSDLVSQKNTVPSNYNPDLGPVVEAFPLNVDYEFLWTEYFLSFLSRAVYYLALPEIVLQTGSNGLFLNNTEFSSNSGLDGLKFMQDTQLQNLEKRRPFIIDYLCKNKATYPLFCEEDICGCCDDCTEVESASNLGMVIY